MEIKKSHLAYVLDEHLRGHLWRAIQQWNAIGAQPLDVVRVGDTLDLPLGTLDPELLAWAEREGRLLVTLDKKTMIGHLRDHLDAGNHSPGVFIIRPGASVPDVREFLVLAAYASDPLDWRDFCRFIP
jgi:hypothetical protein